jgi:hypothetical protein
MVTIPHKRGDTFNITCSVIRDFGDQLTLVRAHVKNRNTLVEALTFTELTPTVDDYIYKLSATATQTALWPVRDLTCDIEYQIGANIASTETFIIRLMQDETV